MTANPKTLDLAKLRRLIRQREDAHEAYLRVADRYRDLKTTMDRLQIHLDECKRSGSTPNSGDLQSLTEMRQEWEQLKKDMTGAEDRFNAFAFLDDLIDYARKKGVKVNAVTGFVRYPTKAVPEGEK